MMDGVGPNAAERSTYLPAAAQPRTVGDRKAKSGGLRGVSQIGAAPCTQVLQGFLRQLLKPTCGDILLELLVPHFGVERRQPGA